MKSLSHFSLFLAVLLFALPALALKGDEAKAREGWQRVAQGATLVDVRTPEEYEDSHVRGAINLPMDDEAAWDNYLEANPDTELVLYCGSGRRAGLTIDRLAEKGVTRTFNASGRDALEATDPERID